MDLFLYTDYALGGSLRYHMKFRVKSVKSGDEILYYLRKRTVS